MLSGDRPSIGNRLFPRVSSICAAALTAALVAGSVFTPPPAYAAGNATQSISFSGTNVGETSSAQTLIFSFGSDVTLGSVQVLTQGASKLDFQRLASDNGSTACQAGMSYTSGQTCSVQVTFTPMAPGPRMGAVVLSDNSTPANVIATAYASGTGEGAGIAFAPAVINTITGSTGTNPAGLTVDAAGNLYIADSVGKVIHKIAPGGPVATIAGGGTGCAGQTDSLGDGCPATSAILNDPQAVAIDGAGNLYIADSNAAESTIREVGLDGTMILVAGNGSGCTGQTDPIGDGCPAIDSQLDQPQGIAVDGAGVLYIADSANLKVRQIADTGTITSLYSSGLVVDTPVSVAPDGSGNLYFAVNGPGVGGSTLYKMNVSGGSPSAITTSNGFGGIAVNAAGDIYVSDISFGLVREVSTNGTISVVAAGTLQSAGGLALDATGDLYIADATGNRVKQVDTSTAPQLSFATTPVGATSSNSPQTVTISNIGNQSLTFSAPSAGGSNPSYPQSFPPDPHASGLCTSTTPVGVGASCSISVDFTPATAGNIQANVILTDNALDVASGVQMIPVSGTAQPAGTVTINTAPQGLQISVDGGAAQTTPFTVVWTSGSQHTIAATTPETVSGTQYAFAGWSDNGAISHTVTASASILSYTAYWSPTAYLLTTAASAGGTVSPASGTYYPVNATVNLNATPNPGYTFLSWTGNVASVNSASTTITMSAPQAVTASFFLIPSNTSFVVNTASDDAAGMPSNCTTAGGACTLRDALSAANLTGSGTITFDPTVFAASQPVSARTITVTGPTLNVPSNTTITGPTTGSGSSLTPLVSLYTSVNGSTLFSIATGETNVAIANLSMGNPQPYNAGADVYNNGVLTMTGVVITGQHVVNQGGGIFNDGAGTLTLTRCSVTDNAAWIPTNQGAGIDNAGTLTMTACTVSGNTIEEGDGAGIDNEATGTLTIVDSTISGNEISNGGTGGGIQNNGKLTLTSTTVSGNGAPIPATGSGIENKGTMAVTNSIVAGNATNGMTQPPNQFPAVEDDCDGSGCPVNGASGNVVGAGNSSTLPGSAAICAGLLANIPPGLLTDQRGLPRTTKYGNTTCVDSGAIETNYALSFSTQPPATIPPNTAFAAAVQLSESGSPFPTSGILIPMALGNGDNGTLTGNSAATGANGVADFSQLQVSAFGTDDTLVATLPLTTAPPPAPLTAPISINATSSSFNVGGESQTITFPPLPSAVSYGVSPITLQATASSGLPVTYSATGPAAIAGNTLAISGPGTVVVTASQAGNSDYLAASPVSQTVVVKQASTSTTLSASPAKASLNNPVTFTAVVASPAGTPAGNVQFLDGSTLLGTSALNAQGSATYTTSALGAGSHSVAASYAGNVDFAGSGSTAVQVEVNELSQTIAFAPLVTPVTYGVAPIPLKATASSGLAVAYSVTGPASISGSTLIINGAGTVTVTAAQPGNSTYAAGTPVSQTLIVNKAASTTTLNSSSANANLDAPLTFTAEVTSVAGTPAGAIQFLDGTTLLGSSALNAQGVATYTASALSAGSHTINAVYTGDQNFAGSQSMLTQTVTAPGFTLSASPSSLTLNPGQSGRIQITLTPVGGYSGSITLACSGLPELSTCSFSPATLTADGSNTAVSDTLTIATTGSGKGTVAQLNQGTPAPGSTAVLICWLPGGVLGILLYWQRKRMPSSARHILWVVVLLAGVSGMIACGSPPMTPDGTSAIKITAQGPGNGTQSITINVTIAK